MSRQQILLLLSAIGAVVLSSAQYTDRKCGEDMSNLWLDVIAVVDNSNGMTVRGLDDITTDISRVFGSGTRIGVQANEPRTTRVGLVIYNENAYIAADLNQFQSIDNLYDGVHRHLAEVSPFQETYLANGLLLAEQLFNNTKKEVSRAHYQKVILVFSSTVARGSGDLDPFVVSNRLIASGVTIITVVTGQNSANAVSESFERIASPMRNFVKASVPGTLLQAVQSSLLQANCFCPNGWEQYRSSFANTFSHRYGVCIQAVPQTIAWNTARIACKNRWTNAYLVNEFSAAKHSYVFSVVRNTSGFIQPYKYHIGMSYSKGQWSWEQPVSQAVVPLQNYFLWSQGAPEISSTLTGVLNQQIGTDLATMWKNVNSMSAMAGYTCQVAACDTDNYCAKVDED